jgi:hypothetical protein
MIIKKRTIPLSILKHQALLLRLPPTHPKIPQIKENLSKRLSGFKGGQSIDYPLSFLSEQDYFILHDLRIKDSSNYFQIDSIIMTRSFFILLEVKNIVGTIYFDQNFHQLIRTLEGKETAFRDPITQSNRHELQMKKWLAHKNIPKVPIISLIVISKSNTIIRTSQENTNLHQKIIHSHYLPTKIQQIERQYPNKILTEKELKKVSRLLKKSYSLLDQPILEQYEIFEDELLKDIICPSCNHLPMVRIHSKWACPNCHYKEKDAHMSALNDYILLLGSEMTNQRLREFLNISSLALATRFLRSMNVSSSGTTRDRVYDLTLKDVQNKQREK